MKRKAVMMMGFGLIFLIGLIGFIRCQTYYVAASGPNWLRQHTVRVELETPGGPIPFYIRYQPKFGYNSNVEVPAQLIDTYPEQLYVNEGSFEISYSHEQHTSPSEDWIPVKGTIELIDKTTSTYRATISFNHYDSRLISEAVWDIEQPFMDLIQDGVWQKRRSDEYVEIPFRSVREDPTRSELFEPAPDAGLGADFAGRWSVRFGSSDEPAIGVFRVGQYTGNVTGTFMTTTGDYRYLAGRVDGDLMRLSTFDGAHAFLFHARMLDDGTIEGDFWSGNWWHETWTAERNPDALLPDMFGQTTVADAAALDDLTFKALDGTPTGVADLLDATGAPARVLYVFGTWCPNCSDAAAELKRLKDLHGDDLGVVGLAFELTDDHDRSAQQVERYLERHGGTWPILIAGLSDKSKASAELPILDRVRSYPTTIFLNRDNEIVSVHTGFTGPATGEVFSEQQREYERIIDELIGG